ncbi:MAG: hypothetical protein OZSIB_2307 [Candidatus Ozemobacter sibiricus]|uniref:Uncharacterized protein n=1 Tax=Candidatus Ozemobacter sibiricus TaxID=2268124 RepID=A0A367ZTH3_9BACT|nr:MAG: hypothetical protein OZSIB_2307 [Candidatus Ozemobacter sibiricus]
MMVSLVLAMVSGAAPLLAKAGMPPAGASPARADKPMLWIWRGFRRAGLDLPTFRRHLATRFIPATVKTPGRFGLQACLVVMPLNGGEQGLPDEISLVAYRSSQLYRQMNATPEGKAYQDSQWELFDRSASLSLVPQAFTGRLPTAWARGLAYDLLGKPVDWSSGHTVFYLGRRHPHLPPDTFMARLHRHLAEVRRTLPAWGLDGYLTLLTGDYHYAFLHWPAPGAHDRAMASPVGLALRQDAAEFLEDLMWSGAQRYDGWIEPGECIIVPLPPPPSPRPPKAP